MFLSKFFLNSEYINPHIKLLLSLMATQNKYSHKIPNLMIIYLTLKIRFIISNIKLINNIDRVANALD